MHLLLPASQAGDEQFDLFLLLLKEGEQDQQGDAEAEAEGPPGPGLLDGPGGVPDHADEGHQA